MGVKIALLIIHDIRLSACEKHVRNCEKPIITRHTFTYHLKEITGTVCCAHRNDLLLPIDEWKTFLYLSLWRQVSET